uniref:Fibronectin type-III domain-containing protein n=1 Tax=Haplochromis burtoni TaxID=8153 RepID=A0A3Q2WIZ4_HAPBU
MKKENVFFLINIECTHRPNNSITLSWKKPINDGGSFITAYILEQGEGEEKWKQILKGKNTSHTIGELTEGKEYSFRVKALNESGEGPPTDNPSITVGPATCVDTYGRSFHVGLYLCIFFCNYALSCILRYLFHTLHILHPDLFYHLWSRCPRD